MRDGTVSRSLLFETDPNGRVIRLEVSSAAGLLTLHPEGAGSVLHGNVVTTAGIRHLTLGEGLLFVLGSPTAAAIGLGGLARQIAVGATERVSLIRIDDRLEPGEESWDVTRVDEWTWRLSKVSDGETRTVRVGADGLVELPGGVSWPLEL